VCFQTFLALIRNLRGATLPHKIRKISQNKICKPASDAPKCRFARLIRTYSGRITRVLPAATSAISASSSTIISHTTHSCQYFHAIFLLKKPLLTEYLQFFRHFTIKILIFLCVSQNFPCLYTKMKLHFLFDISFCNQFYHKFTFFDIFIKKSIDKFQLIWYIMSALRV